MVEGDRAEINAAGDSDLFELKDNYPSEFSGLAIGVPINADTYTIKLNSRAFHEGMLRDSNLLILKKGSTETKVWAGASDSRWQYTSGWNASASMRLNFGIVDFAAKFYAKQTEDECNRSSNAAIVGVSTRTAKIDLVEDMDRDLYYNCTTKRFQDMLDAVKAAADRFEASKGNADFMTLLACLRDFYETFGTGFVSGLDLVAYGVFEAVLTKDSKAVQDIVKIGGGIAAAVPFVTGEAAGEYLRTYVKQDVNATFRAQSFGMPTDSPPEKWADKARGELNGESIEKFLSGEVWTATAPAQVAEPNNPDITPQPIDLSKIIKFPELPGVLGDAVTLLKHAILGLSGGAAARSAAAVETQRQESSPGSEVRAREDVLRTYAGYTQEQINTEATAEGETGFRPAQPGPEPIEVKAVANEVNAGGGGASGDAGGGTAPLNLGDYVPGGYRYLPWKKIFPALKITSEITESQVVFGQSLVWLSIRRMFAQYLEFCCQFQGVARNEYNEEIQIANQSAAFRTALDTVSEELTAELTNQDAKPGLITETGRSFLQTLEDRLRDQLYAVQFDMYEHYLFWIDNYEWLKQCAFGVVAVVEHDDHYLYQKSPYPKCPLYLNEQTEGFTRTRHRPTALDLIRANAYRLYPILSTTVESKGGKPCFAWVGAPTPLSGSNADEALRRSGLLTLAYRQPEQSPEGPGGPRRDDWVIPSPGFGWPPPPPPPPFLRDESARFDQTVVPMLIHQSPAGAKELLDAENAAGFQGSGGRTDDEALQERWDNRKKMFGMHLYPGHGEDTGFGPGDSLLRTAGRLAHEATEHATVMPTLPEEDDEPTTPGKDRKSALWEVQGVCAAYSPRHQAVFLWGPEQGPGWRQGVFDPRPVRFIPVGYTAAEVAVRGALMAKGVKIPAQGPIPLTPDLVEDWMKAGGGPMWARPKTDLFDRLWELADKKPESAVY